MEAPRIQQTKFGHAIVVPDPAGGKARYVDVDAYLAAKGVAPEDAPEDDVRALAALPRDLGDGATLHLGRNGFYVKGLGDLPKDMWDRFATLTLDEVRAKLGGASFVIDGARWTAIEGRFGPALRGPPRGAEGRDTYVGLQHFLDAAKKPLAALTAADAEFMASLPRQIGDGHAVACGRDGFYVTGPAVKGTLRPEVAARGAAMTLDDARRGLAAPPHSFQIGGQTWAAREGKFGPMLQGPPDDDGKPRYVDLKFYLAWKKKAIDALTHDDVALLAKLPRDLGAGYTASVGQYGFYVKGPDGKYKTLSDTLANQVGSLTLADVQHLVADPFGASASRASAPKKAATAPAPKKKKKAAAPK